MGAGDSSLSSRHINFLTQNTGISQQQVREYYSKFKKSGDPRKARINKKEFCEIMQTCYPRTYRPELAEDIFRIYDKDNNGSVDFQEFLVIIYIMSDGTVEEKLKHIFRIIDSDGNGSISTVEMGEIVEHLFHLIPEKERRDKNPREMSEALMSEMDNDSDGLVTEAELMAAFLREEMFTTLLVNKLMQRAVSAQANILRD